jgi:hypothetical protein
MTNTDLTREEWVAQMEIRLAFTTPDMYPSGFARFMAESHAEEGGYDRYVAGEYAPENIWEPKND